MIYLDSAATTQPSPGVVARMREVLEFSYGNPETRYDLGRRAKEYVDTARQQVADAIGAFPKDVLFTSGGSESNNAVFFGVADWMKKNRRNTVLISEIEHESVLKSAKNMCIKLGFYLHKIPVDSTGNVNIDDLTAHLRTGSVGLVSVMYMNNEIGTVQRNMRTIEAEAHRYGALYHTDCVQAFGAIPVDVGKLQCDFLSVSSHKIHGPKGCGALYVSDAGKAALKPLIYGGDNQEFGFRGGTENVPGIVGFGQACSELDESTYNTINHLSARFLYTLYNEATKEELTHLFSLNNASQNASGKVISLRVNGLDNEVLQMMLDREGVCVGTGSACTSVEVHPSHVLKAIGLTNSEAMSTIRISFSKMNKPEEVEEAARTLVQVVKKASVINAAEV